MAEFNLSTFRSKIHSIGRNQYFIVRIPQAGDSDVITALARTASIPAMTHDTIDVAYRGLPMKIDGKPTFANWTVNFLADEAHAIRHVFLKWMAASYSLQTLRNFGHNDYKRDNVSVSQLAANGKVTSTITFVGMFPINVGEVALEQVGGAVETFNVEFAYDYYTMIDLEGDVTTGTEDITVLNSDGTYTGVDSTIKGLLGIYFNLQ